MSLVICGISGILLFLWMSQIRLIQQMEQRDSVVGSIELIREQIRVMVLDRVAWSNMVTHLENQSLACLRETNDCTDQGGDFSLLNSQNQVLSRPGTLDGFSLSGEHCQVNAGTVCEIIPRLSWRALCSGVSPCLDPLVEVTLNLTYQGSEIPGSLNLDRLGFKLVRQNQFQSTFQSVSSTLGSVGLCPAGSVANGHLPDGSVSCINAP